MPLKKNRRLTALTAAVLALAVGPGSAAAATTTSSSTPATCPSAGTATKVFSQFGDSAEYTPAPNGTFQNKASGWTIVGNAKLIADTNPFGLGGSGAQALQMGPMSVAISPPSCVTSANPYFRYLIKSNFFGSNVTTGVDYLGTAASALFNAYSYTNLSLLPGSWSPSAPNPLSTRIPLLNNGSSTVRLVFTDLSGSYTIGDVFVDPWAR